MIKMDTDKHAVAFGQRIKKLRLEREWTAMDLTLKIKIPSSAIYTHETSGRLPSVTTLMKFAKVFNVSTDYLLGLSDKC